MKYFEVIHRRFGIESLCKRQLEHLLGIALGKMSEGICRPVRLGRNSSKGLYPRLDDAHRKALSNAIQFFSIARKQPLTRQAYLYERPQMRFEVTRQPQLCQMVVQISEPYLPHSGETQERQRPFYWNLLHRYSSAVD